MIKQAICLHEEDNAVLWKHVDSHTGAQVRRMRRMVVSIHATVANYEYLIYWRFYQDGNIECEVRATGLMVTTPLAEAGDTSPTGTLVDQRTYAPFHQHFLVARLDLDVDGADNTVVEVDSVAAPISADNPYGLALHTRGSTIASESESARDYKWETQRAWKVENPTRTNRHGTHPAYKLVPGAAIPPLLDPSTPLYQRAPVIGHTLWVTAHDDLERWPAGAYPTQSSGELDPAAPSHGRASRPGSATMRRWRRRRGALVRLRHPPHHPGRGLADHARRHHLVLAEALRFLRPEPVDGRAGDGHPRGRPLPERPGPILTQVSSGARPAPGQP